MPKKRTRSHKDLPFSNKCGDPFPCPDVPSSETYDASRCFLDSPIPNKEQVPKSARMPLTPENILFLFLLGGVAGTVVETIYCFLLERHFAWRAGLMFVPFNPVYGGGILMLYFALRGFDRDHKLRIFLTSYVVGTFAEYLFSFLQEHILGSVSWDYSTYPLNIAGRVCLIYSLGWGVLGLIWTLYVCPALEHMIQRIPTKPKRWLVYLSLGLVVCSMLLSSFAILCWRARSLALDPPFLAPVFDRLFPDSLMHWFYPNLWFRIE